MNLQDDYQRKVDTKTKLAQRIKAILAQRHAEADAKTDYQKELEELESKKMAN